MEPSMTRFESRITEYSKRYHSLVAAVKQDLCPLGFQLEEQTTNTNIMGGFFMWVGVGLTGRVVLVVPCTRTMAC
jgi:hypothetical protein